MTTGNTIPKSDTISFLIMNLEFEVEHIKKRIDTFADAIKDDPFTTLDWGSTALNDAAEYHAKFFVMRQVQAVLQNERTCDEAADIVQSEGDHRICEALSINSTSAMSNAARKALGYHWQQMVRPSTGESLPDRIRTAIVE